MKIKVKNVLPLIPLLHNLKTIKKEDESGLLYSMDYHGDYYKLLPLLESFFHAGCSVFSHVTPQGERLLGRNFDLRHYYQNPDTGETEITGLITVLRTKNRKAKYRSIGVCDAMYLDPKCRIFRKGSFDHRDKNTLRALLLPFLTMDGVNEKGLAVSILFLSTDNSFEEIPYKDPDAFDEEEKKDLIVLTEPGTVPDKSNARLTNRNIIENTADRRAWKVLKAQSTHQTAPGKKTMIHTLLMRMMLDSCANCEEAVALARTINLISLPGADYHIMVTDTRSSVMLEWINNELTVQECCHAANFYNNRPDHFGYGQNRDEALASAIERHPEGITEQECMEALREASQNCLINKDHGFTQWSAVYNLNRKTLDLAVHSDYEHIHRFELN